jgi:hypothetical protein
MFRRLMFGDRTSAASTVSLGLCSERITHCPSTTRPELACRLIGALSSSLLRRFEPLPA